MKIALLEFLICPQTKSRLECVSFESCPNGDITDGVLCDSGRSHFYPIFRGVPSILPRCFPREFLDKYSEQLALLQGFDSDKFQDRLGIWSFSSEWEAFFDMNVQRTWGWDIDQRRRMVFLETQLDSEALQEKIVCDAGCGNGQLTDILGQSAKLCIGIDFSSSVFLAEEQRENPNVHFIRTDVLNPPFDDGVFDLVYSSGVLHHTPDTRGAMRAVCSKVRDRGRLYVWLYRHSFKPKHFLYMVVTEFMRFFTSRSPRSVQRAIVRGFAAFLYAMLKIVGDRKRRSYEELVVGAYDALTPRYARRHNPFEIASWFHDSGFSSPTLTHWDNPNGFGMVAIKTSQADVPGVNFGQSDVTVRSACRP